MLPGELFVDDGKQLKQELSTTYDNVTSDWDE